MNKANRQQQVYEFSFQGQQLLINEVAKIPRIKFETGIMNSQRNQKNDLIEDQVKSQISAIISLKIAAKFGSACLAACKTSSCVILVSSSRMPISVITLMAKTGSPI